jgi:hypothetical protein
MTALALRLCLLLGLAVACATGPSTPRDSTSFLPAATTRQESSDPSRSPDPVASGFVTVRVDGDHAALIATVIAMLKAYNAADIDGVLGLLADQVVWSDCDYRQQTSIGFHRLTPRSEITSYLRERFADHDHLEISTISYTSPEPPGSVGRAVSVAYGRRTSDTLTSLGFPTGVRGPLATKLAFAPDGRIVSVSHASFPPALGECRPSAV